MMIALKMLERFFRLRAHDPICFALVITEMGKMRLRQTNSLLTLRHFRRGGHLAVMFMVMLFGRGRGQTKA